MPRLPVDGPGEGPTEGPIGGYEILPPVRRGPSPQHRRRQRVFRLLFSALVLGLSAWLVSAALSPSSGWVERPLLLLIAVLLPLHLVFFHLNGIKVLDRIRGWPRPLKSIVAIVALAASPMLLYPLGLIAIGVSLFAGDAATPALAVTGGLMLSPIIAIVLLGVMFALGRHK